MAKQKEQVEKWKDLVDPFWGKYYQVSDQGRFRSKGRTIRVVKNVVTGKDTRKFKGRILKLGSNKVNPNLYIVVGVRVNGVKHSSAKFIAKEVGLAFIPRPKEKQLIFKKVAEATYRKREYEYKYVENINRDYTNNKAKNLRWVTRHDLRERQIADGMKEHLELFKHSPQWQNKAKK